MSSLNRASLIGYLGRDPETRRLNSGAPVVNLSLATSESWTDKRSGERVEKTEWHRIVIFNEGLCKIAEQYLRKGSQVFIEGKIQTRKWTDQAGVEKYSTEIVLSNFDGKIVMLSRADGSKQPVSQDEYIPPSGAGVSPSTTAPAEKTLAEELDDEIPF